VTQPPQSAARCDATMADGATMTRHFLRAVLTLALLFVATVSRAAVGEPDYSVWTTLLQRHYDPAAGMNYGALKARDLPALQKLRSTLARVDVKSLTRDQQLAYWINLYNINSTAIVAEKYPIESIRDLSTDLIIRLNVFDKKVVPFGNGKISLNDIENTYIREGFHDPRIHFAINCAAKSCPPIRREAFTGARVQAQLDDQARTFLNGTKGMRISGDTVHVTKIMDWFEKDFDKWGGGVASFLRKYASPENRRKLDAAGESLEIDYDDYDWSVNDRR
jgi:hypothetical protein